MVPACTLLLAATASTTLPVTDRVLVLRPEDSVLGQKLLEGSGRSLAFLTAAALRELGVDAVVGTSRSIARGLDEASDARCTLIAEPQLLDFQESRKRTRIALEIVWTDLSRQQRARCRDERQLEGEPSGDQRRESVVRDALRACLAQVYPPAAPRADAAPARTETPLIDWEQLGSRREEIAARLAAGDPLLLKRLFDEDERVRVQIDFYPAPAAAPVTTAAEATLDPAVEVGYRLIQRLTDRAMAALAAASGVAMQSAPIALMADDPLDRLIRLVPVTPPVLTSPAAQTGDWALVSLDATGAVTAIHTFGGDESQVTAAVRALQFSPGTRDGRPAAGSLLVRVAPPH